MTAQALYLEDLKPGDRFISSKRRVSKKEMIAFAKDFDPQPFHLDHAAAKATVFGGLAASGWHTAAITMRLFVDSLLSRTEGSVGLGIDKLRWHQPVRPGDSLSAEAEILQARVSRSQPGHGVVRFRAVTSNQRGEAVLTLEAAMLVTRRPRA